MFLVHLLFLVCPFLQGLRNDFKDAFDKLDQEYLDQLAKQEVSVCVCVCVCVCLCVHSVQV